MTLTRGVALPSGSTVGGGVLANARPAPDGWTRGLEFATEACLTAAEHVFCHDSPTDKEFQSTVLAEFEAFGIELSVVCSTLSGERNRAEREARAFQALRAKEEFSVGHVLVNGTTQAGLDTGNPALVDATSLGSAVGATAALAALENSIATNLQGYLAWIHTSPGDLVSLVAEDVVYMDDLGAWRSPGGHLVVSSPGYTDLDGSLVASTEVFASTGTIDLIRTEDRNDNRYLAVHEAPAIAVFDPCYLVSIEIATSPS